MSGALVELRGREIAPFLESATDAFGMFAFRLLPAGDYTLSAVEGLRYSPSSNVALSKGAAREVQVVLKEGSTPADGSPAPPGQAIEFSDKPNFSIAGVTDWTAVGGHGSDATLRTSEDLARETLGLKANEARSPIPEAAGRSDGEEVRLLKAIAATPHSYTANRELGDLYLRTGQYQRAMPPLKLASELNHDQPEDEYRLALACCGVGDFMQARQHLQQALKQKDLAEYHHLAGEVDERLGDPLSAVRQEELATGLDPSEENYFGWGSELLLHRAIWQAAQVFAKGAKAHPQSARLKTAWGAALFAGALYDEAARRLCEASDLNPADEEPYLFMGKIVVASPAPLPCVQQKLQRFVEHQPANANANFFYAMVLSKAGQAADAQRVTALLRKTIALDPKFSDAYLQLGILSFAQHRYPEALALYQKAAEANPQSAEAHYRLGVAYDRAGSAIKARQELALHDELEKAQADAIEQQRREIKQFLVDTKDVPAVAAKP